MTEEEQRAALYRAQRQRRMFAIQARFAALAGDPVAAPRLRAQWQPIIDWAEASTAVRRFRQGGWSGGSRDGAW